MKKKAVVLLSSGLDSTVNFYWAQKQYEVVLALTIDYGQRAAKQEIRSARRLANELKVVHQVLKLPFLGKFGGSSLTDTRSKIPVGRQVAIDNLKVSQKTAKSVWVPNRNGIFLNVAAGFAESLKAKYIIPGFNAEEATTFPDNSEDFLQASTKAFVFSTANHVQAHCFTTAMTKTEIVKKGQSLNVNWSLMWPCYFSEKLWCGQCESCKRSKRAFIEAGITKGLLFK